jgi:hypothetical protein
MTFHSSPQRSVEKGKISHLLKRGLIMSLMPADVGRIECFR